MATTQQQDPRKEAIFEFALSSMIADIQRESQTVGTPQSDKEKVDHAIELRSRIKNGKGELITSRDMNNVGSLRQHLVGLGATDLDRVFDGYVSDELRERLDNDTTLSAENKLDLKIKSAWDVHTQRFRRAEGEKYRLYGLTDPKVRNLLSASTKAAAMYKHFAMLGTGAPALQALKTISPVLTSVAIKGLHKEYKKHQEAKKQVAEKQGVEESAVQDSAVDPAETIEPGEVFQGWSGDDQNERRGIGHVIGAYFTDADVKEIRKRIDPSEEFRAEDVKKSAYLLRHLRSQGIDFNVRDVRKMNQIDIRLNTGENATVRVFDPDKEGAYIGRTYDAYNTYHVMRIEQSPRTKITPPPMTLEDTLVPVNHVLGLNPKPIEKAKTADSSRVNYTSSRAKWLAVAPIKDRYKSTTFATTAEAEEYLRFAIDEVGTYVDDVFEADQMQAIIDRAFDEGIPLTSAEFKDSFEPFLSTDDAVREVQEAIIANPFHSEDKGREKIEEMKQALVGSYDEGFDPSFIADRVEQTDRGNSRTAMMAALKRSGYPVDKIKGNTFGVDAILEQTVAFDPETAKGLDAIDHPMMKQALTTVQETLTASGIKPTEDNEAIDVVVDDNGIIRWEGLRPHTRPGRSSKKEQTYEKVSGEIGQVFVPDEHGIIKTGFQGDNNYAMVPGYTGYFTFDETTGNRMDRFRVKGYEQVLTEQLKASVTHQVTRPYISELDNIDTTLDASKLNGLYHGDVYGKRLDLDFMETSALSDRDKTAIIKTLSQRVRFDNQYSDYATTSAETRVQQQAKTGKGAMDEGAFSYWEAAGSKNMRVLDEDMANVADLVMTGTGKTQGLIWYLTDGAEVQADGKVAPSEGLLNDKGERVPDKTALRKLPYFDYETFNAWDRNQMSSNQLMTALSVDEKVGAALMTFGGWTFEDSYAVSKEFAERNKVLGKEPNEESMRTLDDALRYLKDGQLTNDTLGDFFKERGMRWSQATLDEGITIMESTMVDDREERQANREAYQAFLEEHGRFRPLTRGDKISDFGGNKGTIGIVIDRDMDPEEAKRLKLDKEVAFLKANPGLDVIGAPYSPMSRHNAGVVKELMDGEVKDLVNPETGETIKGGMGHLNIIVTDMKVDKKSQVYTEDDIANGRGRKASNQLAWALQAKDATGMLDEIYGHNDAAWATFREYLIATGMDMKPDGTLMQGYHPHHEEERRVFEAEPETSGRDFLRQIKNNGGFLQLPFDVEFRNGKTTDQLPVLSASLRKNVELVDGSMRRDDFTNDYLRIYDDVVAYQALESEDLSADEKLKKSMELRTKVQQSMNNIQDTIIDRKLNGGHNGKHSYLRDNIMSKKMRYSSTSVAIADPRLDIGEMGVGQEMIDALDLKEGDTVSIHRDPVWRDGAIRSMKVKLDPTVEGIAFNPITAKSHDGDFDGDTYGIIKYETKAAQRDLEEKFSHEANMIDNGDGKENLYFGDGMDISSATRVAEAKGDKRAIALYDSAHTLAKQGDVPASRRAKNMLTEHTQLMFRKYGFASQHVDLTNRDTVKESFQQIVNDGAKGNDGKLQTLMEYFDGKKTMTDARNVQYATGVKSDDTGLAGATSQKLVSLMRNTNIAAALEVGYQPTQGTLQVKHDAEHARVINKLLSFDLPSYYRGMDPNKKPPKNPGEKTLTRRTFVEGLHNTLSNEMKTEVDEAHIEAISHMMMDGKQFLSLDEAITKNASAMDLVAYDGGEKNHTIYDTMNKLARDERSLLEGKYNRHFAPFSMRQATEETVIAKKDTWVKKETPAPEVALDTQKPQPVTPDGNLSKDDPDDFQP